MTETASGARRLSKLWYAAPAAVLLVTLAVAMSHLSRGSKLVEERIQGLERSEAPGQSPLSFDRAGEYILYVEGPVTPSGYVDPGEIILLPAEPESRRITLREYPDFVTYTDPSGLGGRAAFSFTVPEPGRYTVKVRRTPDDVTGIAIGRYVYRGADAPVRTAFEVAAAGIAFAIVLTTAIAIRRRIPRGSPA